MENFASRWAAGSVQLQLDQLCFHSGTLNVHRGGLKCQAVATRLFLVCTEHKPSQHRLNCHPLPTRVCSEWQKTTAFAAVNVKHLGQAIPLKDFQHNRRLHRQLLQTRLCLELCQVLVRSRTAFMFGPLASAPSALTWNG